MIDSETLTLFISTLEFFKLKAGHPLTVILYYSSITYLMIYLIKMSKYVKRVDSTLSEFKVMYSNVLVCLNQTLKEFTVKEQNIFNMSTLNLFILNLLQL